MGPWLQHKNNKGVSMSENNLERVSLKGQLLSPTLRQTAVLTHYNFSFEDADQRPYASPLDDIP